MKIRLSPTSRANLISWVSTIMVIPDRASSFSRSSCSLPPRSRYPISSPSTQIRPALIFSRWLMQRRNVDLPEPDGPITTATSPERTVRSMPLSTSRWPKDLCTLSARTIRSSVLMDDPSDAGRFDQRRRGLARAGPVPPGEVPLDVVLHDHQDAAQDQVPQACADQDGEHVEGTVADRL